MELMGEFPKSVAFSGKYSSDFFNRKGEPSPHGRRTDRTRSRTPLLALFPGELRHIQKLRFWPLGDVLHDKYLLPKEEADMIASFLNPMLRLVPEKRAKASELIHHQWLDGLVVQGEIDVIRRAEEEDRRRRALVEASKQDKGKALDGKLSGPDEDAMKPVEESVASDDVPKISVPVPSSAGGKENASRAIPTLQQAPPHPKAPSESHKR